MGRDATTDPERSVAGNAVLLAVARNAVVHRAAGFETVQHRPPEPHLRRRMETAGCPHHRRAHRGKSEPRVAFGAECLGAVAAATLLVIAARDLGVGEKKVSWVHALDPHAAVVAVRALVFAVAARAAFPLIRRHPSVAHEEIDVVVHPQKPAGRIEPSLGKSRTHPPVAELNMTGRALVVGGRAASPVTLEAAFHRRQVAPGGAIVDSVVAGKATHPEASVALVRESKAWRQLDVRPKCGSAGRTFDLIEMASLAALEPRRVPIRLLPVTRDARRFAGPRQLARALAIGRALMASLAAKALVRGMLVGCANPRRPRGEDDRGNGIRGRPGPRSAYPGRVAKPQRRGEAHE